MRCFTLAGIACVLMAMYGCKSGPDMTAPVLTVKFTSQMPTSGEYRCLAAGAPQTWSCEFRAEGLSQQTFNVRAPAERIEEVFIAFEAAVNRARAGDYEGEFGMTMELRGSGRRRTAVLKAGLDEYDAIFRENTMLAQLHREVMRSAGVPKRYWYYKLPRDAEHGEWAPG